MSPHRPASRPIKAGDRLPTEQELREQYDVSRNTVRLALGLLQNEGMISSVQGRGTVVREQIMLTYHAAWAESRDRAASDQTDAFYAEMKDQGRTGEYRDFEMRIKPASVQLAARLRVEEGDSLVSRAISRYVDGQPFSLQDSYYPMDIAQECGLITPHDVPGGVIRAMAAKGHAEIGYVDELTTRMPQPDEARKLGLGTGTPVMVYVRTTYSEVRPLRLTLTIFPGDKNRVVYELGDLQAYTPTTNGAAS
ncbi:GntR family transcriptional regulator [Kribbella sp. VKM Ac-2568]|uniref:GntR family transcriptional regulator n=1 Tax=Kribbella sp. VKM Ac-2568 TaxID=2512219 RepID=UPI00104E3036|nr:GntR family transcriptional regulator [Kribbella sp. VKM Ac-2568]TCM43653.1 GntR family transcriptional regulator [Kribbella sp. VKM Ac-2568]